MMMYVVVVDSVDIVVATDDDAFVIVDVDVASRVPIGSRL
jgi:hypothetical protein